MALPFHEDTLDTHDRSQLARPLFGKPRPTFERTSRDARNCLNTRVGKVTLSLQPVNVAYTAFERDNARRAR